MTLNNGINWEEKITKENGYFSLNFDDIDIEQLFLLIRKDKNNLQSIFNIIFNKYLAETGTFPRSQKTTKFIFRGQADNNWPLNPAYLRFIEEQKLEFCPRREYEYITDFLDACDLANVQLPSDSLQVRALWKDLYEQKNPLVKNSWLTPEYFELLAFAQHYGLKTRLLDWSHNPLVALYFACSGALRLAKVDSKFSLWIMCIDNIEDVKDLKVIEVPKALNQHISFQQGCFTFVEQYPAEINNPKVQEIYKRLKPDIDLSTIKICNETDVLNKSRNDYLMLKININSTEAIKCFDYCNGLNINAATLYRGQKGAVLHSEDIFAYKKKAH